MLLGRVQINILIIVCTESFDVLFFCIIMALRVFDRKMLSTGTLSLLSSGCSVFTMRVASIIASKSRSYFLDAAESRWPFLENLIGSYAPRSLPPIPLTEGESHAIYYMANRL